MQNFLEISLDIITNHQVSECKDTILKINNGLFEKDDCNYIVANLFDNRFYIIREENLDRFLNQELDTVESIDSLVGKRINPFIEIDDKNVIIRLKNRLTGEEFEIDENTMEEICKFKKPLLDSNKHILDSDNMDFYNFIVDNNIIY